MFTCCSAPRVRRFALLLCVTAALCAPLPSRAFCGFFVAKADADIFNDASKVVLARHDGRTVITMANDYRGEPEEFAMVVPVPEVLKRGQINIAENATLAHLDAYTAPRLAEYHDENPCRARMKTMMMRAAPMAAMEDAVAEQAPAAYGVTVEAEYEVGEYDIQILSGKESAGLIAWLRKEGYNVPLKAEKTVSSYLKSGMFFFVAKINIERQEKEGNVFLRPLQVAFESDKFMLPIRLGTVNADGMQDLIIYALTKKGRVEPVNYRMTEIPTNTDIPVYIKDDFAAFYKEMFAQAVQKEDYRTVMLEYAWNMSWCDPCAADPLSNEQLRQLGAYWLPDSAPGAGAPGISPRFPGGAPAEVYVTRMHLRYDAERFPEDLRFQETANTENFQGRYVIRHLWQGEAECEGAKHYLASIPDKLEEQARNLSRLTGRDMKDIRAKMAKLYPDTPPAEEPRPWYERMWDKKDASKKDAR